MATHPEIEAINAFEDWEFFVTLTFKGKNPPRPGKRKKMLTNWLRGIAKELAGRPFKSILWALRDEQGESTGRHHYHILLGRTGLPRCNRTNFTLMSRWKRHTGGGFARSSVVVENGHGKGVAAYLSKGLVDEYQTLSDAAEYEVRKYGWANENPPVLSFSLIQWLKRQRQFRDLIRACVVRESERGHGLAPRHNTTNPASNAATAEPTTTNGVEVGCPDRQTVEQTARKNCPGGQVPSAIARGY